MVSKIAYSTSQPLVEEGHEHTLVEGFSAQPKIKYFMQVKARPPTFVAFVSGKVKLQDTDIRVLTKSLKEHFNMGGIPIRIMQRVVPRREDDSSGGKNNSTRFFAITIMNTGGNARPV